MSVLVAGGTKIEWADFTFNPWWGCERVSPGCAHCYADTLARRRQPGSQLWGESHEFRFFGDGHWAEPLRWARTAPAKLGRRPRVFCASMADVFEERLELGQARERLFALIAATPELDWLILTKRPEYARLVLGHPQFWFHVSVELLKSCVPVLAGDPGEWARGARVLPNVWLGVSIENSRYTWRADVLRKIPAAVRFISAEPLLGSLFEPGSSAAEESAGERQGRQPGSKRPLDLSGIDWVIVGGESGPGARPFHLQHAREIVAACQPPSRGHALGCALADVNNIQPCDCDRPWFSETHTPAVFVKQLGAKPMGNGFAMEQVGGAIAGRFGFVPLRLRDSKGGDPSEWPADLRIREFPRSAA